MNIIHQIQARIGYLAEQEKQALQDIDQHLPGSISRAASWELIRELSTRKSELKYILQQYKPEEAPEPGKVQPMNIDFGRTKEQDEAFQEELIEEGLNIRFLDGEEGLDHDKQIQYFKNLQQYSVNVASVLWVGGFIEKLEELERMIDDKNIKNMEEFVSNVDDWVNKTLHDHHQNLETLTDNCKILEKELAIQKQN